MKRGFKWKIKIKERPSQSKSNEVDSAVTAIVKPKVVAKISRVLLLNKIRETSDISASIARLIDRRKAGWQQEMRLRMQK